MRHISADFIKSILEYCADTGEFKWLPRDDVGRAWNARYAGKIAGRNTNGYRVIAINRKAYYAHRLAWVYVTGEWPKSDIDHINLNKSDNRLCNLREASRSQNSQNTPIRARNTCGLKGVTWHKKDKKWQAQIMVGRKPMYLGSYKTPNEAHDAYVEASRLYHREFGRAA